MNPRTIATARGTVHYWIGGAGEDTLVFTHGATMDHGMWQFQLDAFSSEYRVITWDVPLHGLSRPYEPFTLQHAARDLLSILDVEGARNAHLVGQSMGGYISQIAAAFEPGKVRSVVAVDSSPVQTSYYSRLDRWLLALTPALLGLYPYSYLINLIATSVALTQPARAYALETLRRHSKREIAAIMGAVYTGLVHAQHDRLTCPVLVTYGELDTTGKVRAYCDRWAKEEQRTLKVIPGAAHNANMDNPAAFNHILANWFNAFEKDPAQIGGT